MGEQCSILQELVKSLPKVCGVYIFKNNVGNSIYIGKAKNIYKRVSSYFVKKNSDWKIQALLDESVALEHIITKTEHESLVLEAELIQRYQPKYNVLLKSGQPFLFLIISHKQDLPLLEITRIYPKGGAFFGPFIHKQQIRSVYEYLLRTFHLYLCNKKIANGCLDYHIGKCAGSCRNDFDKEGYLFRFQLAITVLEQNSTLFIKQLKEKMQEYANDRAYEKAKNMREYLYNIEEIFKIVRSKFDVSRYQDQILHATGVNIDNNYHATAQELQTLLKLPSIPITIDCFDISHFQSNSLVGSCVRFVAGVVDKKSLRKFKITTLAEQNDYAALYEVVSRRYKHAKNIPDLVLIDGGKGQRNAVLSLLSTTQCISLAKKEETIFCDAYPDGIKLDLHSSSAKLLIALRDYAHHFAITYHRILRSKKFTR